MIYHDHPMNRIMLIITLFELVDELNTQLPEGRRLEKSLDTALIGKSSKLDSLGLLMMINATEACIHERYGMDVELPFEATVQRNSPFQTIGTLVDYILAKSGSRD